MQSAATCSCSVYRLSEDLGSDGAARPELEYRAIFKVASDLILGGADRASIVVFVGGNDTSFDAYSVLIGMLPFRGLTTTLVTRRSEYGDLLNASTPSGVFAVDGRTAGRMGMYKMEAVFGLLTPRVFEAAVAPWDPMDIAETISEAAGQALELPFKIGGLVLPMVTHNQQYREAVQALARTVARHYEKRDQGFFPIVSCGETCDALGYGSDVHDALTAGRRRDGFYFAHKSGESYKRSDAYDSPAMFAQIAAAKQAGLQPLIVAVGGGVNGNCIGLIAALTGADFIECPTTPMHYNDATTSAKKAFSLVKDDVILSKNILGAFYLPRLVFCVADTFITLDSSSVHATVGEATKTMNMLGMADSAVGAADYNNITGASEFASDFTQILSHVGGFEKLVSFIKSDETVRLRSEVVALGGEIKRLSEIKSASVQSSPEQPTQKRFNGTRGLLGSSLNSMTIQSMASMASFMSMQSMQSMQSMASLTSAVSGTSLCTNADRSGSVEDDETATSTGEDDNSSRCTGDTSSGTEEPASAVSEDDDDDNSSEVDSEKDEAIIALQQQRTSLMATLRGRYHDMAPADLAQIRAFLTTINLEVVKAKAMFLAYSDPFEKYRALLFEYAHTLGHGIEAFANRLYITAKAKGVVVPNEAVRLHGQCVGMAVLWAGSMSQSLGVLEGQGLALHQSMVYLFNRHGGFSFAPLRALCESLGVSCEEMCEGVLKVVRRDNKRGYCTCSSATASVDQLVAGRPGRMLRSADPEAELRYLVEVPEALQVSVLARAWSGEFDLVADMAGEAKMVFSPLSTTAAPDDRSTYCSSSLAVSKHVRAGLAEMYAADDEEITMPTTSTSKAKKQHLPAHAHANCSHAAAAVVV